MRFVISFPKYLLPIYNNLETRQDYQIFIFVSLIKYLPKGYDHDTHSLYDVWTIEVENKFIKKFRDIDNLL